MVLNSKTIIWLLGTIATSILSRPRMYASTLVYDGQLYTDVPLKYDILDDQVAIRSEDHLSVFKVRLIEQKVSSFRVHDRDFVRLIDVPEGLEGHGFFEVAAEGQDLSLYIKHKKRQLRETIQSIPEYRLVNVNYYLLKKEGAYHVLDEVRDFKQILPNQYAKVKTFYKQHKKLHKTNRDEFMINLINYIADGQSQSPDE